MYMSPLLTSAQGSGIIYTFVSSSLSKIGDSKIYRQYYTLNTTYHECIRAERLAQKMEPVLTACDLCAVDEQAEDGNALVIIGAHHQGDQRSLIGEVACKHDGSNEGEEICREHIGFHTCILNVSIYAVIGEW